MYKNVLVIDNNYQGLNPVLFGYENCKNSHSYGPAIRPYYLIHFVVSGFGTFVINDNKYSLGPGEMFVIPPNIETYYEADAKKPWSYIWIGFTCNEFPITLNDTIFCPDALTIFNSMKDCERFENGRSAYLTGKLWELISLISESKTYSYNYIDKALNCIHSEYMKELSVNSIAERLGLDRSYFATLFTKKTGVSPKKYLLNYRMSVATSLLSNKNTSITIVANSVGYTDVYNFSKMFKKHFGVSPSKYISKL